MEKRQMDDMMKELLVAGLKNYNWGSLSSTQLLMLVRIIGSMETVNGSTNINPAHLPPLLANIQSSVS